EHVHLGCGVWDEIDSVLAKIHNIAVLDMKGRAGEETDSIQTRAWRSVDAIKGKVANPHDIARARHEGDGVRAGSQPRRDSRSSVDCDRFGDGDAAEPAGIERIDLAPGRRF